MKVARNIAIASAVAIGLAASAGLAVALSPATHILKVQMPDGGTAEIQYAGDVPPKVSFTDMPAAFAFPMKDLFADDPAFADLRKMSAAMDSQMNDLMSRATAPGGVLKAGGFAPLTDVAPADGDYTMISTQSNGNTYCERSVEVTRSPGDKAPKVVTHTSGDCKALDAAGPAAPAHATGPQQVL
jgi:hypothetical protein